MFIAYTLVIIIIIIIITIIIITIIIIIIVIVVIIIIIIIIIGEPGAAQGKSRRPKQPGGEVRPISLLGLSLLRFLDSTSLGNPLWT